MFLLYMRPSPKRPCRPRFHGNIWNLQIALAFAGYFQLVTKLKRVERIVKYKVMYALLIVPTLCVFVFSLYPIFLQTILNT